MAFWRSSLKNRNQSPQEFFFFDGTTGDSKIYGNKVTDWMGFLQADLFQRLAAIDDFLQHLQG
jgi:hypothetical protein